MARIIIYQNDDTPNLGDKWIGTDRGTGGTRNFTASGIADLFNNTDSIGIAGQNNFKFVTDQGVGRTTGSISLANLGGDTLLFADLSELIVSRKSLKNVLVDDYMKTLAGNTIIISGVKNPNYFGVYVVEAIDDILEEPDYLKLTLYPKEYNGLLESLKTYSISAYAQPASEGDKSYTHTQDVASATWNVSHSLNKYPSVTVALPTGQVGVADVTYTDTNNLIITFAGDESGKAYIN